MKRRAAAAAGRARVPSGPARPELPRRPLAAWPALALLAAATMVLHPGTLSAPFYGDDLWFLDQARGRSLWATLAASDPLGNYFRPVSRQLLFWLVGRLGGESALAFHLLSWTLWLLVLAFFVRVARRVAGARAAVIGAAFLALHYAADVPLMWASDTQDLLAIAGALVALDLYLAGRRAWAAAALGLALLSKETVVLMPALAILLERRPGESWRVGVARAWPLGLTTAAWLALWLAARVASSSHPVPGVEPLRPGPFAPLAALVHLVQVAVGLEWGPGGPGRPWQPVRFAVALVLALAAVLWQRPREARAGARPPADLDHPAAVRAGVAWAVLAALPVSLAIRFWSAYGYLFALCGVALALGAWAATRPRALAVTVVALLALGSASGRGLQSVAIDYSPWTTLSHINRFVLDRGMAFNARVLPMLRALRPSLPANSSLFFSGVPKGMAFQVGDGPLVRWAYRDTSLRSYFRSQFSLDKARRGPTMFFTFERDTLYELPQTRDFYRTMALGMIFIDALPAARDVLTYGLERDPGDQGAGYWLALTHWGLGARDSATDRFERAGWTPAPGPTPELRLALARLVARDTLAAVELAMQGAQRHALDPEPHALVADLLLPRPESHTMGMIEAFAARVLAPEDARNWRRWGLAQLSFQNYDPAGRSLERYMALGGMSAQGDSDAVRTLRRLRRILPGGDLARRALGGSGGDATRR